MEEQNRDLVDIQMEELMREEPASAKKKTRRFSRRKKLCIGGATALVLFLAARGLGGGGSAAVSVPVVPLQVGTITEELTVSGPVSGTDSVDVVSGIHAEVSEILVKEGDRVEAGQLLAVINSEDLQKEVDIAQNACDLAEAAFREQQILAENGYAKAAQDYEAARTAYERTSALFQSGSVSQLDLETAANQMQDAQRELRAYRLVDGKPAAPESYELQIQSARYELDKRKEQLENARVTSPIAGTVVRVYAKVGRFADDIENDLPMFSIENLDVLEMEIKTSEYSIGKVETGQAAEITADILDGQTAHGEVVSISPTGEEKGGGSTERVIPAAIRITDADSGLMAGITARARIRIDQAEGAFIVPMGAVLETDEGTWIFAAEGNRLKRIPVETGVESDVQIQVIPVEEGSLQEGMQIAASASADMADGMQVLALPQA